MDKDILRRNQCIIWHKEPEEETITTCRKEADELITLKGLEARLWFELAQPCSIGELKERLKKDKDYPDLSSQLESTINSLIEKKILKRQNIPDEQKEDPVLQKFKNMYANLLQEVDTTKSFSKNKNLSSYHKESITATKDHFELNEVTVSHVYREPHPVLGGLSYGARLYKKLDAAKKITPGDSVVEVGAGLGYLARSFLDQYKKENDNGKLQYTFCDLTFKFVESQRELNKHHNIQYCQANAQNMPFKGESIDLIIDNENIADFTAVKLNKKLVLDYLNNKIELSDIQDNLVKKSLEWVKIASIDVSDAASEFIFNIGAAEFIKEVKRVLKKGGLAFITEYGIIKGYPTGVSLDGHVEYSIQFSHLINIVKALGLSVRVSSLLDFLEFDKETEVIEVCSLQFIYNLLKKQGKEIPFLAYTKERVESEFGDLIKQIHNLKFNKIGRKSVCHNLNTFYVLLLSKN